MCVILHVALPRPHLSGQKNGPSVECGKVWVVREFWGDLDSPVIWVDCDEPAVEESVQVAPQEQSASRVMLRVLAVHVQMSGL
jgi:hypothetical protein